MNFWCRKMKCRFKGIRLSALPYAKGFSLPEVMAAVTILALISTSVWVVINRCMASAADSVLRMQAFEIARENMEKLLVSDSVAEQVEYGSSDEYPDIEWQTVVEMFYEPLTSRAWIRAVCSAEYTDIAGDVQTVELTHWLTDLTKEQLIRIMKERKEALTAEQIAETEEEAAAYAGVDERTIQQWIENGMPTTEDGHFIKDELDLYRETDGSPTIADRKQQIETERKRHWRGRYLIFVSQRSLRFEHNKQLLSVDDSAPSAVKKTCLGMGNYDKVCISDYLCNLCQKKALVVGLGLPIICFSAVFAFSAVKMICWW